MDFTGAILCLVVTMKLTNHVTGEEGVCDDTPCLNGGQCIDLSYPGGPQEFKCSCREGFKGLTCQKRIDPCIEDPCLNGGSCVPNGEHYRCICSDEYEGKNCDVSKIIEETCSDKPCGAHGVCEMVNDDFICECFPGYQGPRCETAYPEVQAEAEAKSDDKDDDSTSRKRDDDDDKAKMATWDIRNMLITLVVFFVIFILILLFLCIHCSRVYKRRTEIENIRKAREAAGLVPPPMPGWLETSNKLCNDCMCYLCITPKKDEFTDTVVTTQQQKHMFHKPHSIRQGQTTGQPMGQFMRQPQHHQMLFSSREPNAMNDPNMMPSQAYGDHEDVPQAIYTSSPVPEEFYAFEDPDDVPPSSNLNENQLYRNSNRNYVTTSRRYKPASSKKSSGRHFICKKKEIIPLKYDVGHDDDEDDDDDDSYEEHSYYDRSPRGLLPGFSKIAPDRRPRKITRCSAPRNPGPIRENRRLISTRRSRELRPEFPFKPMQSTWQIKQKERPYEDSVDKDQSEYSAACGDTDDNAYNSSDYEGGGDNLCFEDDGYMSTGRMSESDAGGRGRDPQSMHLCSEVASRNHQARQKRGFSTTMWNDGGQGQTSAAKNHLTGSEDLLGDIIEPSAPARGGDYVTSHERRSREYKTSHNNSKQIKSILKKNKEPQRPKESVIHVRSGIVDGHFKPHIYRDASQNFGPSGARSPRMGKNRNYNSQEPEDPRYGRCLPYPPTYPPPLYEDVAYS